MSTDNKTTTERLSDVAVRANALCQTVAQQSDNINTSLQQAKAEFDDWKGSFTEVVNGLLVHKEGRNKRFSFAQVLDNGGYDERGQGPHPDFRACANPKEPYYINLLEFVAGANGWFGNYGDRFRCEFIMSHRGMYSTSDHIVITGTSFEDCVSGRVEIKNITEHTQNGHLALFVSEPNENREQELNPKIDDYSNSFPFNFRAVNQGFGPGVARITFKVDPKFHCGAYRALSVQCEYSSDRARPSNMRVSHEQPSWNQF
ncbi:hypothetical protein [Pseudoalteromonas rubra]|uniref:Uncharacterized protein n=1 Tax=Pseudoalteromonas rubra TaxID=43658 RepID=A0A0F4QKZ6_9GAMM|nr:hypothetical protein [Pseudoalteromonas rubra]KJZ07974.1 hypothetical protein TW77_14070 [Pseudoalteromonas rubra]